MRYATRLNMLVAVRFIPYSREPIKTDFWVILAPQTADV